jgi:hypothetical protein
MTAVTRKDPLDLLAVTPERFRRALWHSFLRYGVAGDLETAVHAAMNVIAPVLAARDAEITRLREAITGVESSRSADHGGRRPGAAAHRRRLREAAE